MADREYRLLLWNPKTRERLVTDPIQAGASGVLLRHQTGQTHQAITGRVVDEEGNGVVGATVRGGFSIIAESEGASLPNWQAQKVWVAKAEAETDSDGKFNLPNLPRAFDRIHVSGPSIEPCNEVLEPGATRHLEIEVGHLFGFRFQPESVSSYDRFEVFDSEGTQLPIYTDAAREVVMRPRQEVRRYGNDFPFCEVHLSASTLTLFAADGSTLDILLSPRPGAVDLLP